MRGGLPFDFAVANLGRRPLRTLLLGSAAALVAAVLAGTTGFARGLDAGFRTQGDPDVAVLLSRGSDQDLLRSTLSPSVAELTAARVSAVARAEEVAMVSPEIHMATRIALLEPDETEPASDERLSSFVRGVTDRAYLVHDSVVLEEGRTPGPGEVLVGRLTAKSLGLPEAALAPGARILLEGGVWTVSGVFAAPGTAMESEIWAPLRELQAKAQRDDVSAVFVRLTDPEGFDELELFASRRLDLELDPVRSTDYYAAMAAWFGPIRQMAVGMAVLLGIAAVFTGANTVGSTVRDRQGELAALMALGFSGFALVRALLLEIVLLALLGGLVGLAITLPLVEGTAFRIGMGAFSISPGLPGILAALGGVLALAVLGTLPAALRVVRLPVAIALGDGR